MKDVVLVVLECPLKALVTDYPAEGDPPAHAPRPRRRSRSSHPLSGPVCGSSGRSHSSTCARPRDPAARPVEAGAGERPRVCANPDRWWSCAAGLHCGRVRREGPRHDRPSAAAYSIRQAAYDLRKLRGKQLVDKPARTRRHRVPAPAARTIAALLTLRDQVIAPILAAVRSPRMGTQTRALDTRRP